ncbi:hypothetical protein YC2023_109112 [Brassica napus]
MSGMQEDMLQSMHTSKPLLVIHAATTGSACKPMLCDASGAPKEIHGFLKLPDQNYIDFGSRWFKLGDPLWHGSILFGVMRMYLASSVLAFFISLALQLYMVFRSIATCSPFPVRSQIFFGLVGRMFVLARCMNTPAILILYCS